MHCPRKCPVFTKQAGDISKFTSNATVFVFHMFRPQALDCRNSVSVFEHAKFSYCSKGYKCDFIIIVYILQILAELLCVRFIVKLYKDYNR